MKNSFVLCMMLVFLTTVGCSKPKTDSPTYNHGQMVVSTDPSFASVTEALADAYMISYPDTKITVVQQKEDLGFLALLKNQVRAVVMSRSLTPAETAAFRQHIDMEPQPAKFAADAILFIVPKDDPRTEITYDDVQSMLTDGKKNLIFNGTNSSDVNFIAERLKLKLNSSQYSVLPGHENIIRELHKFPGRIGVVGYNILSRPYNSRTSELLQHVKVLPVIYQGKSYQPSPETLINMSYPFTRVLYFLTNEGNFSIANGLIRYSCTQLGQMVVQKDGLQPYNLYRREVQMR